MLRDGQRRPRSETREAVERLLLAGRSQAAIATELGISRPTVAYHVRKLGIAPRSDLGRRYDWDEIRHYYEAGHSARECADHFGFSRNAWADAIERDEIRPRPREEPIDDILAAGRRRSREHVKQRLMSAGLKELRCEACGLVDWRGEPIALQLHHVNGDGLDNRLENLRLLCPNCHSQTDTWGGRNKFRRDASRARSATSELLEERRA